MISSILFIFTKGFCKKHLFIINLKFLGIMEKKKAIFSLLGVTLLFLCFNTIKNSTSANAGYYLSRHTSGANQALSEGMGGGVGAWVGAEYGAELGSFGGPLCAVVGAGLGAL